MNIEQIRVERVKAEEVIRDALVEFKAKTGLAIIACDLELFETHHFGEKLPEIIIAGVRLEIESL